MDTATAVLVVAIVLLTVVLLKKHSEKKAAAPAAASQAAPAVDAAAPAAASAEGYEKQIGQKLKENFSVCGGADETAQVLDCVCGDKPDVSFAKWDYGRPDASYSDYVSSQAVDNKVIENHAQFVRDRRGLGPEGEFTTGRTYSPDSHDSYNPIPWQGIRGRPRAVPQCNPTQVPDLDTNLFKGNRAYCFMT
jgi:hypothetical protein